MSKRFSADDIHEFRLQVKELRALLRMLSGDPGCMRKIKLPGRIKYMYRVSGYLRDLDLFRRIVKYYFTAGQIPKNYLNLLNKKKDEYAREFKKAINNKQFSGSAKKISGKLPAILQQDIASFFYDEKIESIRRIIKGNTISDEEIHSIRKYIKDILYIKKLLSIYTDSDISISKYKRFTEGEQLAFKLGQINDLSTTIAFLEPPRLGKIPSHEITWLASLRQQCFNNKESLRLSVHKKLSELYL